MVIDINSNFDPEPMEGEEFRDVVGYDGYYSISNYGRVRREFRITTMGNRLPVKIMKPCDMMDNQLQVNLTINKSIKRFGIQKLVANAFIRVTEGHKEVVMHKNKNYKDNRLQNLEIVTQSTSCKVNYRFGLLDDSINKMAVIAIERGVYRHSVLDVSDGVEIVKRRCVKCGQEKEPNDFARYDCLQCKRCQATKTSDYGKVERRRSLALSGLQECSRCKNTLPFSAFYKYRKRTNGIVSSCIQCDRIRKSELKGHKLYEMLRKQGVSDKEMIDALTEKPV